MIKLRVQLFIIFISKIIGFFYVNYWVFADWIAFSLITFVVFLLVIISLLIYIFITQYFSTVCGPHTLTQRRLFFFFSRTTARLGGQAREIDLPLPFFFFFSGIATAREVELMKLWSSSSEGEGGNHGGCLWVCEIVK